MALTGYLDWQHYYAGAWLFPIRIKVVLTLGLLILIPIGLIFGRADARAKGALIIYVLCFLAVVGLGFFGGHLVFGRKCPTAAEGYQAGEQIFEATCSSCHPYGGNIVNPNFPLRGAPQLKDFQTFLAFTRNPKRPDGSEGTMPSFPPSKLSDQQAWELYQYIMNALQSAKPK